MMTWSGAGGAGLRASTTLAATPTPTATAAVAVAVAASAAAAALAVCASWDLASALASPLSRGTKALKGKRGWIEVNVISFRSRLPGNLTKRGASALSRPSCWAFSAGILRFLQNQPFLRDTNSAKNRFRLICLATNVRPWQ